MAKKKRAIRKVSLSTKAAHKGTEEDRDPPMPRVVRKQRRGRKKGKALTGKAKIKAAVINEMRVEAIQDVVNMISGWSVKAIIEMKSTLYTKILGAGLDPKALA